MSKKTKQKDLTELVLALCAILLLAATATVFFQKLHPDFDEKFSGKEATVVSETATIYYNEPLGRSTDTVTRSQKLILTGKMAHFPQDENPMFEVRLENDTLAWISKRYIAISE